MLFPLELNLYICHLKLILSNVLHLNSLYSLNHSIHLVLQCTKLNVIFPYTYKTNVFPFDPLWMYSMV